MRYLLIFLMCVPVSSATYVNWVVGGAGTGADKATTNSGMYDADTTTWAAMQGTNGAALGFDVNATSSDNGSGSVRLTGDGDDFENVIVGVGARCNFSEDESADGIHLVEAVNVGADTIDLSVQFAGDGEACDVVVGGALPNPGDVPDGDDESAGYFLGNPAENKIWIRALADYTTVDESDSILYINTPGGTSDPIIWEGHFAEIANEKGDFGIVTFDGQNAVTNCIETAVGGVVSHVFIGFSLERAIDDGFNANGTTDDYVTLVRCQSINNGAWGVQGDRNITAAFCDFDTNGAGGMDCDLYSRAINCVFRNNTGDGFYTTANSTIIGCLVNDNTDTAIRIGSYSCAYGCTVDGNDGVGTEGIYQDDAAPIYWLAINNIITDFVLGIQDDATLRQAAVLYDNLYNSNATDAHANITPQPSDGDIWGNVVDPTNLFSSGYILHADNKGKGVDASYTKAYWDDFNGGAGDNPPSPLSGLSFMDMGGLQREEAGGGGGQQILGGSVIR